MALRHSSALKACRLLLSSQGEFSQLNAVALVQLRALGSSSSPFSGGQPRPPSLHLQPWLLQQQQQPSSDDGPSTSAPSSNLQLLLAFHKVSEHHQLQLQRHISFIRFLSGGKTAVRRQLNLPDAEACDEALEDYKELRQRLKNIDRPASLKTWDQTAKDVLITLKNGSVALVRFTMSVPGRIQAFREMPKDVWEEKKRNLWQTVKHEAHHYWVRLEMMWTAYMHSCTCGATMHVWRLG